MMMIHITIIIIVIIIIINFIMTLVCDGVHDAPSCDTAAVERGRCGGAEAEGAGHPQQDRGGNR